MNYIFVKKVKRRSNCRNIILRTPPFLSKRTYRGVLRGRGVIFARKKKTLSGAKGSPDGGAVFFFVRGAHRTHKLCRGPLALEPTTSGLNNTREKAFKQHKMGGWGTLHGSPPGDGIPPRTRVTIVLPRGMLPTLVGFFRERPVGRKKRREKNTPGADSEVGGRTNRTGGVLKDIAILRYVIFMINVENYGRKGTPTEGLELNAHQHAAMKQVAHLSTRLPLVSRSQLREHSRRARSERHDTACCWCG